MKTLKLLLLVLFTNIFVANAQIGYQISLLDSATGEPRANETVSCEVTLTNAEGTTVYSGTQSATSNDFGVVSLTVGNTNTFKEMDWTKLPLFIEVSVDGKLIGKSQVLNVPVAEYAKKTGVLTYENIGTKKTFEVNDVGECTTLKWTIEGKQITRTKIEVYQDEQYVTVCTGSYYIDGNSVVGAVVGDSGTSVFIGHYVEETDTIYFTYK